jgi:hypothetical protein
MPLFFYDVENLVRVLFRNGGGVLQFTHIKNGKARQVDGSNKPVASRRALTEGTIELKPETINLQSVFNSFIIENVLRLFKLDGGIKFDELYSTKGGDLVQ